MPDSLSAILNRIPLFANQPNPHITELSGGITNRNYKIETADGQAFVLRVGGNDTGLLGIEYGFHVTLMITGVILAYFMLTILRRRAAPER